MDSNQNNNNHQLSQAQKHLSIQILKEKVLKIYNACPYNWIIMGQGDKLVHVNNWKNNLLN